MVLSVSEKAYILGGTVSGLAAGIGGGIPILDENVEGPCGTDFYYCVPTHAQGGRFYTRPRSSEWTRGDVGQRAYQFCSMGLVPMYAPHRLVLDRLRRHSGVVGIKLKAGLFRFVDGSGLELLSEDPYTHPLCVARPDEYGYFPLDGARAMDALANVCRVRRGYEISAILQGHKTLWFTGRGEGLKYDLLLSTLPLDYTAKLVFPREKFPTIARPIQVLNVGMRLTCAVPDGTDGLHQILLRRDSGLAFDAIDVYSAIDYKSFTPAHDKEPRITLALKHYLGANEIELGSRAFTDIALKHLSKLGFVGEIQAAVYHYVRGARPFHDQLATAGSELIIKKLEDANVIQVGSLACGAPFDFAGDMLEGFAAGAAVT